MISWGILNDLIDKAKTLDYREGLAVVFDLQTTKIEIVRLNTEEQLFKEGVNADNVVLGDYTPFSYQLKQNRFGSSFPRHITLFEDGDLYDSYKVPKVTLDGFVIEADTIKEGEDLEDRYGNLEGLTEESQEVILTFITPDYANWLIQEFRNV